MLSLLLVAWVNRIWIINGNKTGILVNRTLFGKLDNLPVLNCLRMRVICMMLIDEAVEYVEQYGR